MRRASTLEKPDSQFMAFANTIHFDRADETGRIVMSAARVNPCLEEVPWSEDITETIG
jgi:hypothetical protein